jgi:hypothetical protein
MSMVVDAVHEPSPAVAGLKLQSRVAAIAASNEAVNIGAVLGEVPGQTADLPEMVRIVEEDQAGFMSAERYHGRS